MRPLRSLIMALFAISAFVAHAQTERLVRFETATATIETANGKHVFSVEVARSPEQQAQGLMYRQRMAPEAGMLFLYKAPERVAFWMKNTLIPLDIIFVGADGRIIRIAERTVPHSLEAIPSGGPVTAVLEVNSGTAARLEIRVGDKLIHMAAR